MELNHVAIRLIVAAIGGLAVGIEREWSIKASGRTRFAGVRTFTLIGLLGALSMEIHRSDAPAVGIVLLGAVAVFAIVAYAIAAHQGDLDGTTEIAALLVLAAGALAGADRIALASAINAVTALILVEKSRIHSVVYRIQSEELAATFRFAVLALVVLPVLPEGPFGPSPGFRPREIWMMVLIFSGLSFSGYLARRIAGGSRGYQIAGILGGLISSTAVTLTFARESRAQSQLGRSLAFGVIGACTVLLIRTPILAFILNPPLGFALIPYMLIPAAMGIGAVLFALRGKESKEGDAPLPKNPLSLFAAIQMAVIFQLVLYLMNWVSAQFGSQGILVTSALLGLTDVDALTFSMAKLPAANQNSTAVLGLVIGILSNTLLKVGIAWIIGRGVFRRIATIGLLALAAGSLAGLLIFYR